MALRIKKIAITNFKVFDHKTFDFGDTSMVVFDGPNGFGKTSFYDAVELLLTGEIRRYKALAAVVNDSRLNYNENPFLHTGSKNGDICVKGDFEIDGNSYVLGRKADRKALEPSVSFKQFELQQFVKFEDEIGEVISDEKAFLSPLLGDFYKENFEFLNYVEQEDNAYLLKSNEKSKKAAISHLFNALEFEQKIDKITLVKKKIQSLCNTEAKSALHTEKQKLEVEKKKLVGMEEVPYSRIFNKAFYSWDAEDIEFPLGRYDELFGEDGTFNILKDLARHKEDIFAYLHNERVEELLTDKQALETYLKFSLFIAQKDELIQEKRIWSTIKRLYDTLDDFTITEVMEGMFDVPDVFTNIFDAETLENYQRALKKLKSKYQDATKLEQVLFKLEQTREALLKSFKQYIDTIQTTTSDCPLCGSSFPSLTDENPESLLSQIEIQATELRRISENGQNALREQLDAFKDREAFELKQLLDNYLKTQSLDKKFIEELEKIKIPFFTAWNKKIQAVGIDPSAYFNEVPKLDAPTNIEGLIQDIELSYKVYTEENVTAEMVNLHFQLFREEKEAYEELTLEKVNEKVRYVEWRYQISQSKTVKALEERTTEMQKQFDNATNTFATLKNLEKTYKDSLIDYNRKLIRDIEILFHIYSGRIIQDFQGGLGLFIRDDRGIKFLTDPDRTFDAVFSMSSGQLAALIISFTLALNQKYSRNKVLFIDDPVQTMDELNIAGFVDLLRNEFSDRQVFISTHENKMSTYMRYKFKKYDLLTKRINLKEEVLN